jgi:NAD-dependent DNA ligase
VVAGIGRVNAQALVDRFGSMDALMTATPDQIVESPGIGSVLADQIRTASISKNIDYLLLGAEPGSKLARPRRSAPRSSTRNRF